METFTTNVSTQNLAKHLQETGWTVFDCRFSLADPPAGERTYGQGHIPGARYAHLDRDLSSPITETSGRHPLPEPEVLARKLGTWGVDNATQVVVYDDAGGAFAARLWWLLRWLGHKSVAVLDGGITQWMREGRPLDTAVPHHQPKTFVPRRRADRWLTVGQVQAGLTDSSILLLDVRAEERFRGEQEPIDPVAGHVPGAVNRPFSNNLSEDGRFLPSQDLRRQFQQRLGRYRPEQLVHMCGSGVNACQSLLAMEIAGLTGSRLYAGSWSEWIRDPGRPVATGTE